MILKNPCIALFLVLAFAPMIQAQDTLNPEWIVTESSPLANGNAEAWSIGSDENGNLFWGVNQDMPGVFEYLDAMVYKLDPSGNIIWIDTAITGTFAQQSYNLKVTDSLVFVGGRTCSSIGTANCDLLFFTTKADDGSTEWSFEWDGGHGYEEIDGIALDNDGIYLTGWTTGDGTAVDILLMKIDYSGNIIWQTSYGSFSGRDDHQDGHIVVDDSVIYISGLYDGSALLGWEGRSYLAKYDKANGDLLDSVKYGRQDVWVNAENALGMTTDGNYLYTTGYTTTSENNWDIFVAKFDKDLNQIWHTTWGGTTGAESARSIVVADDGSIYVGGNTESYGDGAMDMAVIKFSASGDLEWYKTWGTAAEDQTLDIHLHGNQLYLTGKTQSLHPNEKWEAILMKVELDFQVSVSGLSDQSLNGFSLYPNPMNMATTLNFHNPNNEDHTLAIYNLDGRLVQNMKNLNSESIQIKRSGLDDGMYLFQLWKNTSQVGSGKLIVQ